MTTTIISDTSSLIILTKLKRLALLEHLFDKVFIPKRVEQELAEKEDEVYQSIINNPLFEIVECKDTELLELLDDILDFGESEALVLAKERQLILLIDEKKGRKMAKNMGIKIIGFLGVLLLNYRHDKISKEEIEDILYQTNNLNFRLSEKLKQDFFEKL
jgi:predicted nucleic acid-binding protein